MISDLLDIKLEEVIKNSSDQIRAPGLFESHYSPKAKIYLSGRPIAGDGFIAPIKFPTPPGVLRLISPATNEEYARTLYQGLRLADRKKIKKVYIVLPDGDDIAVAICDRLQKASEIKVNV
jgi:L-threonylcarbamoyladenylate synthase